MQLNLSKIDFLSCCQALANSSLGNKLSVKSFLANIIFLKLVKLSQKIHYLLLI